MRIDVVMSGGTRRPAGAALAVLACATAVGCSAGQPVDDPVDGRPCAPFQREVPFRVNAAVSLGQDWGLVTNDLERTQTASSHAGYARLDDDGTVLRTAPLDGVAWGERHQLAWNGTELAYLSGSPAEAHLVFLTRDGVKTREGPGLDVGAASASEVQAAPHGMVAATGPGYGVAYTVPTHNFAGFGFLASTDADGTPQGPATSVGSTAGSRAFALGSIQGTVIMGWMEMRKVIRQFAYAAAPSNAFDASLASSPQLTSYPDDSGDGASDGSTMMFVVPDTVASFDGTTVQSQFVPGVQGIAWTGAAFLLTVSVQDATGASAAMVELRRDLTTSPPTMVFPPAVKADVSALTASSFTIAADTRHALFGLFYTADGVAHQALSQVCL
jgi:hypothetical protein